MESIYFLQYFKYFRLFVPFLTIFLNEILYLIIICNNIQSNFVNFYFFDFNFIVFIFLYEKVNNFIH